MALGLSRKVGEEVVVTMDGKEMVIKITEIRRGNRVHMSFTAPESIVIHRQEVAARIAASGLKEKEPAAPC
jgi:carbon storage regulator CsrA